MKRDPLDKLAHLTQPGAGSQPPSRKGGQRLSEEAYQKLMERSVEQLLTYAAKLLGEVEVDVFEMQELVEAAAEQIRLDIRDMATDGDDE